MCVVALNKQLLILGCCSRLLILKRTSSYVTCSDFFLLRRCYRKGGGVPCLFQEARHTSLHLFCTMLYTRPSVLPEFPVVHHCASIRYTIFCCLFYFLHRFVCPVMFSTAKYGFQCTVFVMRRNTVNVIPILNTF